jgi:branched-chain amino acid transport system ATP-binding protein
MLISEDLSAGYGKFQILFNVNFKALKGELVVIVGPNGSGKTTFLRALIGLATIYSGRVLLQDREITRMKPHERVKLGLAYVAQTENVFRTLTIMENLRIAGYDLDEGDFKSRLESVFVIFPQLKESLNRKVNQLSGGQRQMLAISLVLMKNPKIILLDEPTAQLAPKVALEVLGKIRQMVNELGLGVILVEQNAKKALEIGDKAYLFVSGRVSFEGQPSSLVSNPEMSKLFLGVR